LWLIPSFAGNEDHRAGTNAGKHLRVVACARRHAPHSGINLLRTALDQCDHTLVERDGFESRQLALRDGHTFVLFDLETKCVDQLLGVTQCVLVGVAYVQGDRRPGRNHVDEVGVQVDLADGADLVATETFCNLAQINGHHRRDVRRVAAEMHRCGACMVALADDGEFLP